MALEILGLCPMFVSYLAVLVDAVGSFLFATLNFENVYFFSSKTKFLFVITPLQFSVSSYLIFVCEKSCRDAVNICVYFVLVLAGAVA